MLLPDFLSLSEVARRLGISRQTLYVRIGQWGLTRYEVAGEPRLSWSEVEIKRVAKY